MTRDIAREKREAEELIDEAYNRFLRAASERQKADAAQDMYDCLEHWLKKVEEQERQHENTA